MTSLRVLFLATVFASCLLFVSAADPSSSEELSGDPEVDGKNDHDMMDTDKNGKVTMEEMIEFARTWHGPDIADHPEESKILKDAEEMMQNYDKDGSGDFSLDEMVALHRGDDDEMAELEDEMEDGEEIQTSSSSDMS